MTSSKRRNRSICQKSTIIAANFIRASSFVLAKMALGSTQVNSGISRGISAHSPVTSQQVVGPRNIVYDEAAGSHVTSYVKEPEKGEGVDALAKKYIDKVRKKNRSDISAKDKDYMTNCMPPPPVGKPAAFFPYGPYRA